MRSHKMFFSLTPIPRLVKEVKDPNEAAKKLCVTATLSSKCHDNVTVMMVNLRPEKKSGADAKKPESTSKRSSSKKFEEKS